VAAAQVGCNCYIKQTRPNMRCHWCLSACLRSRRASPSSIHLLRGGHAARHCAASAGISSTETFVVVVVVCGDRLINWFSDCCPTNYQLTCGVNRLVVSFLHCLLLGYSIFFVSVTDNKVDKKISCRRQPERCFVSLNISLTRSRGFEVTPLSTACVSPY